MSPIKVEQYQNRTISKNKNKIEKVDKWEIRQYCHNLTARNPSPSSCTGNSPKLNQFAHLLVSSSLLTGAFVYFSTGKILKFHLFIQESVAT